MFFNSNDSQSFNTNTTRANLLNKLQRSSAVALCENDDLRQTINELISRLANDEEARMKLAEMPEATLPLYLTLQQTEDKVVQELVQNCLDKILDHTINN